MITFEDKVITVEILKKASGFSHANLQKFHDLILSDFMDVAAKAEYIVKNKIPPRKGYSIYYYRGYEQAMFDVSRTFMSALETVLKES